MDENHCREQFETKVAKRKEQEETSRKLSTIRVWKLNRPPVKRKKTPVVEIVLHNSALFGATEAFERIFPMHALRAS